MRFIKPNICLTICILFCICLSTKEAYSQRWKLRRYEISANLGTAQAFGDYGTYPNGENWLGLKDINFLANRPAGGITLRYKIDPIYSVSLGINYGIGAGDDGKFIENPYDQVGGLPDYYMGRKFVTSIYEFLARGEYFIISEEKYRSSAAIFNRRGMVNNFRSIGLYAFTGVGGMYMNPKFEYRNPELAVPPNIDDYVTIDEPTTSFSKFNLVVPIGLGVRYILNDQWVLGGEVGWRWTSTDYLDGFTKENASNKHNDVYYFLLFNATYRIKTTRRNLPAFLDKSFRMVRKSKRSI